MHAPIIRNIAPAPVAAPEPPSILIGLAELSRIVTIAKPVGFYGGDWAALIQPMRHDSTDDPSKRWAA